MREHGMIPLSYDYVDGEFLRVHILSLSVERIPSC